MNFKRYFDDFSIAVNKMAEELECLTNEAGKIEESVEELEGVNTELRMLSENITELNNRLRDEISPAIASMEAFLAERFNYASNAKEDNNG